LREQFGVDLGIIEVDRLSGASDLTWSLTAGSGRLPALDDPVDPSRARVVWWRRVNRPAVSPSPLDDEPAADLVANDCSAALQGVLLTEFGGVWLDHPWAIRAAELKLVQLRAAQKVGLSIPRTVVTQNPAVVASFVECVGDAIVKPVGGTKLVPLLTARLRRDELFADERAVTVAPAIYQELLRGDVHLRVHCFGHTVIGVAIASAELDWRADPQRLAVPWTIDDDLADKLRRLCQALGLRMGIVDLKLVDGQPVFLEINPQGQFLFAEGESGVDLTTPFAAFLAGLAES
jgi:glutathione synthase/RimK-type ligase-like ATP-grasp enzyme